ncbi:MAG: c-type cytochrome [Gammaproteobacteria bacterium]|nr:c-type cytochrome [Gammaproteobacteria bacterium]
MFRVVTFVVVMVLSGAVTAAPDGKALFNKHCSVCHGSEGKGGVGVPLSLPSFINSVSDEYLKKTIRVGRPGRIMPAFPKLSDAQVGAIVGHVRSWTDVPVVRFDPTPVKGDEKQGKELFLKHCAQCHGEDGKGGKGTGVSFSRKRDLPIIAPALNNPGFLASASDMMIKNTLLNGREGTPMNSFLAAGLKEKEINDVVAYVRSFEKVEVVPVDDKSNDSILVEYSGYTLEETVENLTLAIENKNFKIIRTDYFGYGFAGEAEVNKKQVVLHFCNFDFLYQALSIDPRVGMFLPCRVNVVERDGEVKIMTINPMSLSKLFNNDALNEACKEMTDLYKEILEDASL